MKLSTWLLSAALTAIVFTGTAILAYHYTHVSGGWCCLCMCHSVDQNKCSPFCIHLQHGKHIVEEPEMDECTRVCNRYGVKQIPPENLIWPQP